MFFKTLNVDWVLHENLFWKSCRLLTDVAVFIIFLHLTSVRPHIIYHFSGLFSPLLPFTEKMDFAVNIQAGPYNMVWGCLGQLIKRLTCFCCMSLLPAGVLWVLLHVWKEQLPSTFPLIQGFSTGNSFVPLGDTGSLWGQFWLSGLGDLLASRGQRLGIMLNTLRCTGQPPLQGII